MLLSLILISATLPMASLAFSNFFAAQIVTSAHLDRHNSIVQSPVNSLSHCALECEDHGGRIDNILADCTSLV